VSYVYLKSEPGLFTVGFYTPAGVWQSESDHDTSAAAAARVAWLNGQTAEPAAPVVDAQVWCSVCGEDHAPPECCDEFPEPGEMRETGR
jgi:hypothetical protein